MDGYWIWCPSVIVDDDGLYHMFASRWPRSLPFSPCWLTHSEVVRATSPTPEGPYTFSQVILPARGREYWDGCMTHNPSIRRASDGTWLLFYTGTRYDGATDAPIMAGDPGNLQEMPKADERVAQAHRGQRIGLATAPSLGGPWTRRDEPILEPRPGCWDGLITTNPAPCIRPDGSILMLYKSVRFLGDQMHLGAAQADHYRGAFTRLSDDPVLRFGEDDDVEDPFVWYQDGAYHAIMKDMEGGIGGVPRSGIRAQSPDGVHWHVHAYPHAYSREILWDDGTRTMQDFLERPGLILDGDGRPTHFTAATAIGSEHIGQVIRSWDIVVPLRDASVARRCSTG